MTRPHKQNALYTRVLAVGLGISLIVHVTVLALGRFGGDHAPPRGLTDISLVEPESRTERQEPSEVASASDESARARDIALIAWRPASAIAPRPPLETSTPDLSEATAVARASASRVIPPLVPRPRVVPAQTEQGFAPVREAPPTWMLADGKAVSGRSVGRTGGLQVGGVHGVCPPGALPNRSAVARSLTERR